MAAVTVCLRRLGARIWAVTSPIAPAPTARKARFSSACRGGYGQSVLEAKNAATAATSRQSPPTATGRRPNVIGVVGGSGGGGGSHRPRGRGPRAARGGPHPPPPWGGARGPKG